MVKIFANIFIVIFVAIVGFKGYIYYKIDKQLKQIINFVEMSGMATAKYSWISTSFDGTVSVKGVEIEDKMAGVRLNAESVYFRGPRLLDLHRFAEMFGTLDFNELIVGMDGAKLSLGYINADSEAGKPNLVGRVLAAGCGKLEQMALSDYVAMGISELNFDTEGRLEVDKGSGRMEFNYEATFEGLYALKAEILYDDFTLARDFSGMPSFAELEIINENYVEKKNEYCAKLNEGSIKDYITEHVKIAKNLLIDGGIPLSEQTIRAYEGFLRQPISVKIAVAPTQSIKPQRVVAGGYNPEDLPDLLGLIVRFNDTEVANIFDKNNNKKSFVANVEEEKKPTKIVGFTFKRTAAQKIRNYEGHGIRVTTKDGKEYEGIIIKTRSEAFDLEYKVKYGKLAIPIHYKEVEKADVLR